MYLIWFVVLSRMNVWKINLMQQKNDTAINIYVTKADFFIYISFLYAYYCLTHYVFITNVYQFRQKIYDKMRGEVCTLNCLRVKGHHYYIDTKNIMQLTIRYFLFFFDTWISASIFIYQVVLFTYSQYVNKHCIEVVYRYHVMNIN